MKHITERDAILSVHPFKEIIHALGHGAKKAEFDIESLDIDITIGSLTGYWVGDLIRIDIKFKE